jgi:hypothetical protein
MDGCTIVFRTRYDVKQAQEFAGSAYQPFGRPIMFRAEVWSPECQVRADPPHFTRENLKRFHAGWLGVEDYDRWKDSPGGRDDAGRTHVIELIRNGLSAIFPNATFESEES